MKTHIYLWILLIVIGFLAMIGLVVIYQYSYLDTTGKVEGNKHLNRVHQPLRKATNGQIELIIHMVYGLWDTGTPPPLYLANARAWQEQGFAVRWWYRSDVERLLTQYPEYQSLYFRLKRNVQKADLARCLILYDQGGIYMDADVTPHQANLWEWFQHNNNYEAIYWIEQYMDHEWVKHTATFAIRGGIPEKQERLANFVMACIPKHVSMQMILTEIVKRCHRNPEKVDDYGVLYTTGPDAVTDVIQNVRYQASWRSEMLIIHHLPYMRHTCTGTWRNNLDQDTTETGGGTAAARFG